MTLSSVRVPKVNVGEKQYFLAQDIWPFAYFGDHCILFVRLVWKIYPFRNASNDIKWNEARV